MNNQGLYDRARFTEERLKRMQTAYVSKITLQDLADRIDEIYNQIQHLSEKIEKLVQKPARGEDNGVWSVVLPKSQKQRKEKEGKIS